LVKVKAKSRSKNNFFKGFNLFDFTQYKIYSTNEYTI
jgi:hypothetical protein